jgi:hypothetical protein
MSMRHLVLSLSVLLLACGGDDDDGGGAPDGGGSSADASSPADAGADGGGGGRADAGGDDAGGRADAAPIPSVGSAVIDGAVRGQTPEPLHAWYAQYPEGAFAVAMPQDDVTCDLAAGLTMPVVSVGFPCGPAEVTSYPLDANPQAECAEGAPHAWVLVDQLDDGTGELLAASGSVNVVSVDGTAVAGTFDADFGDDGALTGSFNASVCAN